MKYPTLQTVTAFCLLSVLLLLIPTATVFAGPVEDWLYSNIAIGLFGWILSLAGVILDYAINTFVIGFGDEINGNVGIVINEVWLIVRDLLNLTFIFGLVYIGIKLILDSNDSQTQKWLINLIIAALLVNFSLFITKLVVDVSNQLATSILNVGYQENLIFPRYKGGVQVENEISISISAVNSMKLTTVIGGTETARTADLITANLVEKLGGMTMVTVIGTILVFLVASYVFFATGFLFIIRAITLIIFMVLSPFLFIGLIFPGLLNETKSMWKKFLAQAFFAPIYAALLYVTLQLMSAFSNPSSNLGAAVIRPEDLGAAGLTASFGPFIMISGLLIATLMVGKKIGLVGASSAMKAGNNIASKARRGATNAAKQAAIQTGGRAARFASEQGGRAVGRGLRNLQQMQGNGLIARTVRGAARSNTVQNTVGAAATNMQSAKYGMKRTREEERLMQNQTNERANRGMALNNPNIDPNADAISARQQARRQQQGEVRNMTNEEILELARQERELVTGAEFASLLSDAQVTALRNSGILTSAESDELERNRDIGTFEEITNVLDNQNATTEQVTEAMDSLNRVMSTMSNERLTNMMRFSGTPADNAAMDATLRHNAVASRLTNAQVDTMRQSGRGSAAQMTQITNTREAGQRQIMEHGSLANRNSPGGSDPRFQDGQRRSLFRNAADAGRMPAAVLAEPQSNAYLTPRIIQEFLSNNPRDEDVVLVRDNIDAGIAFGTYDGAAMQEWTRWASTVAGRRFALVNAPAPAPNPNNPPQGGGQGPQAGGGQPQGQPPQPNPNNRLRGVQPRMRPNRPGGNP